MRQTVIVVTTALVIAIAAIWGTTVITASSPRTTNAAPASASIDVMQMMKDAKNLPHQQFDAH